MKDGREKSVQTGENIYPCSFIHYYAMYQRKFKLLKTSEANNVPGSCLAGYLAVYLITKDEIYVHICSTVILSYGLI